MKYTVSIDENLNDVSVYRLGDPCDIYSYGDGCSDWVGSFSFEKGINDVLVHTWNFQDYDWAAAKIAVNNFLLTWCKQNNVDQVFIERSEADRFWLNLGWDMVGKCEYLEKYIGPGITCI